MRDRLTGRSRGFGFVTFKEEDSADRAVEDTHQIQGRRVEAKKAIPKGEMSLKSKRIFVGGIPINTSDAQFRKYFEKFGTVTDAQIMKDRRSGRPRGFGFVTFQTESSVEKVLKIDHEINGKFVEVKQAQPKRPHSFGYLNQFVYPTLYPSYFPPYSVEGVHYSFSPGKHEITNHRLETSLFFLKLRRICAFRSGIWDAWTLFGFIERCSVF
eukprot:TRINITY_DN1427_c0_g1_i3.p1 TRINITY_DN1427_c0_g1~~TRINITY_DN1427_c0_g1_i3.p1  ORF type:complete len:212 (-),score=24.86 TRINITY_DN1427_c0_g1_i3:139-774(-)